MSRFTDWLQGHDPERPSAEEYLERVFRELEMFAKASLIKLDERTLGDDRVREGLRWYFSGAAERLCGQRGLDRDAAYAMAVELIRREGLGEADVRRHLVGGEPPRDAALAADARQEGGRTMVEWIEGKDNNAPLRLEQLIRDWYAG